MQKMQKLWLCVHLLRFSFAMLPALTYINCKAFDRTSSATLASLRSDKYNH